LFGQRLHQVREPGAAPRRLEVTADRLRLHASYGFSTPLPVFSTIA
jgi:hypothetical protein